MRILFYLLCFFALNTLYAQRDYHFDYEVKYICKVQRTHINEVRSYFINSKDNSYYAEKIPQKKSTFKLQILDNNGLFARQNFKAIEFESSSIIIQGSNANVLSNPYKYQINNYDFEKHNDTIIDGKQLNRINLLATNSQLKQNKNIGHSLYLIDSSFDFLPMLEFQTAYEIWKVRKNMPNGLLTNWYLYNHENKLETSLEMKELIKRDFKISFSH